MKGWKRKVALTRQKAGSRELDAKPRDERGVM
jgi:hypothetical protein